MACAGRYATALDFAGFWCVASVLTGTDTSVGSVGVASLTSAYSDFVKDSIKANVGMLLYNTTKNTSGYITAVTTTTLTATGVVWDSGDAFKVANLDARQRSTIEHYLDIAASDIHSAMAASGACDCTLASWATAYLEKLNII